MEIIKNALVAVQNAWKLFRDDEENYFPLEYTNYKPQDAKDMQLALVFWKFVREMSWFTHPDHDPSDVKRSFLRSFIESKNVVRDVRLIAFIEMLPTTVWRKVLWRENIDFQS